MTVLNFPDPSASPYEANGITYVWDGEAWIGSAGGVLSGAVDQLVAGENISLDPSTGVGTVTISAEGEGSITYSGASAWASVSSAGVPWQTLNCTVTRNSPGVYQITFITPMPNSSYSVVASQTDPASYGRTAIPGNRTTTGFNIYTYDDAQTSTDRQFDFAVFSIDAIVPKGGTGTDAWGNFSGRNDNGQCTANGSFRIASVTRTDQGQYTVSFGAGQEMPGTDYSVQLTALHDSRAAFPQVKTQRADGFDLYINDSAGVLFDPFRIYIAVNATNATLPSTITQEQLEAIAKGYTGVAAWGNIDGVNATLRGGLNCSVSRNSSAGSEGRYIVTFDTPLPNANYSVAVGNQSSRGLVGIQTLTPTQFEITSVDESSGAFSNFESLQFAVFATNAVPPKGGTGTDAWAYCDSTGAVQASYNCTVSETATAKYSVVFNTPMPTADYAVTVSAGTNSTGSTSSVAAAMNRTTQGFDVYTYNFQGQTTQSDFSFSVNATNAVLPATITQEQLDLIYEGRAYTGVAAWGSVDNNGTLNNGLNCSVAKTDTGKYTVTFDTPLPNANYSVTGASFYTNWYIDGKTANGFNYTINNGTNTGTTDGAFDFDVHALNAVPPKGGTGTDAWASVTSRATDGACTVPGSFNIASVARTSEGNYTVTFANAMPNGNYSVTASASDIPGQTFQFVSVPEGKKEAGEFQVSILSAAGDPKDADFNFTVNATNATLPATITEDQIAALIQNPSLSAWGVVGSDGTKHNNFNIDTISYSNTNQYAVTFTEPLGTDDYSVVANVWSNSSPHYVTVSAKTSTGFTAYTWNSSGDAVQNGFQFQVASTARNGTLGGGADAWVSTNADDGTIANSFNIERVSQTVDIDGNAVAKATGKYFVRFAKPMPNANYGVVVTTTSSNDNAAYFNAAVNGFEVYSYNLRTDTAEDRPFTAAVFATDGNAGGFWVSNDDNLAPLDTTKSVFVGSDGLSSNGVGIRPNGVITIRNDTQPGSGLELYSQSSSVPSVSLKTDSSIMLGDNRAILSGFGTSTFGEGLLVGTAYDSNGKVALGADGVVTSKAYLTVDRDTTNDTLGLLLLRNSNVASSTYNYVVNGNGMFITPTDAQGANANISLYADGTVTTTGTINGASVLIDKGDGTTLNVKDRLTNLIDALTTLKTDAAAATDLDELKAAIATALTNF